MLKHLELVQTRKFVVSDIMFSCSDDEACVLGIECDKLPTLYLENLNSKEYLLVFL